MLLTGSSDVAVAVASDRNRALVQSSCVGIVDSSPGWDLVVVLGGFDHDWLLVTRIQRTVESGSVVLLLLLESQEARHRHSIVGIMVVSLGCVFSNGLTNFGHCLGTTNVEPLTGTTVLFQKATRWRQAADTLHDTIGN